MAEGPPWCRTWPIEQGMKDNAQQESPGRPVKVIVPISVLWGKAALRIRLSTFVA